MLVRLTNAECACSHAASYQVQIWIPVILVLHYRIYEYNNDVTEIAVPVLPGSWHVFLTNGAVVDLGNSNSNSNSRFSYLL